jgi:hypothetical protein
LEERSLLNPRDIGLHELSAVLGDLDTAQIETLCVRYREFLALMEREVRFSVLVGFWCVLLTRPLSSDDRHR